MRLYEVSKEFHENQKQKNVYRLLLIKPAFGFYKNI